MNENLSAFTHGYQPNQNDLVQQYQVLHEEHQEMAKNFLDTRDELEKSEAEKESLMKFYNSLKVQLQSKVDESDIDK